MPRNPILIAALFALSGAVSYGLIVVRDEGTYLGGVTFGLLAAWQFVRSAKFGILTVIAADLVWIASERIAILLIADQHWNPYMGMAIAGLTGGAGVAAAAGLVKSIPWSAAAGVVAALPFGWWQQLGSDRPLPWCFVLWQAAVGTTLLVSSSPVRALPDTVPDR